MSVLIGSKSFSRRRFLQAGAVAAASGAVAVGAGDGSSAAIAERVPSQTYPFTPNGALLDAFVARRGGPIGTGGKVAVAFRCDHHLNRFQSKLLPLHRQYGIPVTVAAMSQMFDLEHGPNGSANLSFSILQKLALENGLEIANHSSTHTDAPTAQRLREEIVYSRTALAKALPKLPIELFIPPGVAGTRYQGFAGGKSPASFQKYLAGRLITQEHALSTGYVPGYWPMTGNPLDSMGNVHIVIENADYARRGPSFVRAAAQQGRGVCFMYHPSLMDDADIRAVEDLFAWCARERDQRRMEILTTSGLMMSSFNSSSRHDLLSRMAGFKAGWNGWNGAAAKWALYSESGTTYARRGAGSTALYKDVSTGLYAGSARQLLVSMRSTTGIRAKIEVLDPIAPGQFNVEKIITLVPSAGFKPVHQYVVLPLVGSPMVRVRISPLTGGELNVQEPRLLAA
ncbi:Polysaccharide deacetylase [Arthrobacter sp. ok909]|nr:Polysaccharide deacetylase [Arthrobacter sp. ok909]